MVQEETHGPKKPERLNDEWIAHVDLTYYSPRERAQKVWSVIQEACDNHGFQPYDILCFALEYAAGHSVGIEDPKLLVPMKHACAWLYNLHYFHTREFLGDPDKKRPDMKRVSKEEEGGILNEPADSSEDAGDPEEAP